MRKKRLKGIIICSVCAFFFALVELFNFLAGIVVLLYKSPSNPAPITTVLIFIVCQIPKVILLLLAPTGALLLRKWGRNMFLYLYPVVGIIPSSPYRLLHSLMYFILLIYLTRPNVKKEFG
ncbi:MAG: hypothetical protein MJA29_11975 [Candidatus Omnitrophica bacterium]|nr:hypothetical protein [Candidatus Omnitrophota bacterium]